MARREGTRVRRKRQPNQIESSGSGEPVRYRDGACSDGLSCETETCEAVAWHGMRPIGANYATFKLACDGI